MTPPIINALKLKAKVNMKQKSLFVLKLITWANLIRNGTCAWGLYLNLQSVYMCAYTMFLEYRL